MAEKPTMAASWGNFAELVMPPNAPDSQRREMRRAFYAGFHQALVTLEHAVGPDEVDEDAGVKVLEALHEEAERFAADVANGRA